MTEGVGSAIARTQVPEDRFATARYESRAWSELHGDWQISMYPVDASQQPVDSEGEPLPTAPGDIEKSRR
jgi:hypothetical protein